MDDKLYFHLADVHYDELHESDWETTFEYEIIYEAVMQYNSDHGTTFNPEAVVEEFLEKFHEENA